MTIYINVQQAKQVPSSVHAVPDDMTSNNLACIQIQLQNDQIALVKKLVNKQ